MNRTHPIRRKNFLHRWSISLLVGVGLVLGWYSFLQLPSTAYAQGTIIVNSLADNIDLDDDHCTLREAIRAANLDLPKQIGQNDCESGIGNDTIRFSVRGVIYLDSELSIESNVVISGPVATDLILDGIGNTRIFAIKDGAQVTLYGLTIANGRATDGGGLYNNGNLVIERSIIRDNQAIGLAGASGTAADRHGKPGSDGRGGGIYNDQGKVTVAYTTIMSNTARGGSGGRGYCDIPTCVSGGGGSAGDSYGGGVYNAGELTLENSTISGNHAVGGSGGSPGGISIGGSGGDGNGGGIYHFSGNAILNHTTISSNNSHGGRMGGIGQLLGIGHGGGIFRNDSVIHGALFIKNTILAGNSAQEGPDCQGSLTSQDYNLIGNTVVCIIKGITTNNITTQDPLLAPLQDNGGNTFTHAFLKLDQSKAFNAIPGDHCLPTDQRGISRPQGAKCDIGAYESDDFQARIYREGNVVSGALIYQQTANQTDEHYVLIGGLQGTDEEGYSDLLRTVNTGDSLVILAPAALPPNMIEQYGTKIHLYYTNAIPTTVGLAAPPLFAVKPAVLELTGLTTNPLLIFDLDIALEWDASSDTDYLFRLTSDLKRASEILFDFTNGRAALGRVRVFQDAKRYLALDGSQPWLNADIRIYASNQLHPTATQGGIVATGYLTESLSVAGATSTMTYTTGQVNIGAVWNADGETSNNTGEDWARALAHELGHYLFFLDDSYLGEDEHGYLVPVDTCQFTAMTDPFREDYTEFLFPTDFQTNCQNTLAAKTTGRSDWETIQAFYPALQGTASNIGPNSLPLAVTQVEYLNPADVLTITLPTTPTQLLSLPDFYLIDQENRSVRPGSAARAFLYQENQIFDLGSPLLDRVTARGVRKGDEVCLYDPLATRFGCVSATTGNEPLKLVTMPAWQPQLEISPVTSRTVDIRLPVTNTGLSGLEPVQAQLFAETITQTLRVDLVWDANTRMYSGQFRADLPVLMGYVRLWVNESLTSAYPRREIVADYQLGGSPVPQGQRGVPQGQRGVPQGQRGVPRLQRGVPASSANGQVIIYGEGLNFPDGEFFTLQTMPTAPQLPTWVTLVGQVYHLSTSAGAPALGNKTSITFQYLGRDVPPGEENFLRIYQYELGAWRPLSTTLNTTYNVASAAINAPGIYALMSSFEIPLSGPQPGSGGGWNNVAYMTQTARPVAEALKSIEGFYTIVWGYEPKPTDGRFWQAFDPTLDPASKFYDLVNNLKQLQFGRGYWIHATRDITLFLKGDAGVTAANLTAVTSPPALYYGDLWPATDFTPTVGMPVTAWIGNQLCGLGQVASIDGQLAYVLEVAAQGNGAQASCGTSGQQITFQVNGMVMLLTATWDNQVAHYLPLTTHLPNQVFLPVVGK